jgi:hypothetical protein
MDRVDVPDDVKRFILISIHSIPQLEAMLLLRNESERDWDGKQVARRLYMSEKAANELLMELHAAGVLDMTEPKEPLYRYRPVSEELRHMIDRLAETYSRHLIEVTKLIHSKTSKKAQQFADAFIWRKDS